MFLGRGLDAVEAAGEQLAALDPRFLFVALVLQLGSLGFRAVIWRNVLAAAYPDRRVPLASVAGSYAVGVALNAFLPARGGEIAKLALVRSRIQGSTIPTIASTLSLVLLLDTVLGGVLLLILAALGTAPIPPVPSVGILPIAAGGALLGAGLLVYRFCPRPARSFFAHLAQGAAIMRTPGRYARTIAPFQLAAWTCRIGVSFFVLYAFGIHAGIASAAFLVVLNGLSTVIPVPGGVGTQQVLAAYALRGFVPLAGAVSFSIGLQVGVTTVNTLVGLTAMMLMFRTFRPFGAVRSGLGLARSTDV
jgi:hypothetical protein